MRSKRPTDIFIVIAFGAMTVTGCATSTQTGAAGGVLHGKAVGREKGALITPQLERSETEAPAHSRHTPKQGHRLIVEGAEVVPAVAKPGDEVRIKVRYSVLAPNPQATIPVTETWLFKFNNQPVGEPIRKPTQNKAQGGYCSTYKFKVTSGFPRGHYQVLITISNGTMSRSISKNFSI